MPGWLGWWLGSRVLEVDLCHLDFVLQVRIWVLWRRASRGSAAIFRVRLVAYRRVDRSYLDVLLVQSVPTAGSQPLPLPLPRPRGVTVFHSWPPCFRRPFYGPHPKLSWPSLRRRSLGQIGRHVLQVDMELDEIGIFLLCISRMVSW